MHRPTVNITLYKQRITKDGKHNYKLWVTFKVGKDFKQRMYGTRFYATVEEDEKIRGEKKPKVQEYLNIRSGLRDLETQVNKLIDDKKITTQEIFELNYLEGISTETLQGQFELKKKKLLDPGTPEKPRVPKISNAEKYKTAYNSFVEFSHPGLTFHEITKEWLEDYEEWYTRDGSSLTSVGINCRCLRHIFNRAIKAGIISDTIYPFRTEDGYTIPEGGDDVKQFLEEDEKQKFLTHRFGNESDEYLDYAIFSYLANGLNFSDIFRMRKGQINYTQGYISITRQKTKGKKKKIKRITIILHPMMEAIIKRYTNNLVLDPNELVFPILKSCKTEEETFHGIRRIVNRTNRVLKALAEKYEFPITPTTYTLRHTFSYTLMQMGGTTEELQDALGHGDIRTTEHYKHGFSLAKKRKFSEGLGLPTTDNPQSQSAQGEQ